MDQLWTPPVVAPTERKREGGTHFDDEMEGREEYNRRLREDYETMVAHINERPDHTVYVSSAEDRGKMREVFNHMKSIGVIGQNPNIRIEYGLPDGAVRIAE